MQIKGSRNGHPPLILSVEGEHGCWVPNRINRSEGYIKVAIGGRKQLLHRYMYERVVGPIPPGHDIHHAVCGNRRCCNPMHVQSLVRREHIRISHHTAARAARTHCPHGHEYVGDNLVVYMHKNGPRRNCRECHRIAGRERLRKEREQRLADAAEAKPPS